MTPRTIPAIPPGPSLVEVLRGMRRDPLELNVRAAREYGDVVRLPIPGDPTYLVSHPGFVEHLLLKNVQNYPKGRLLRVGMRAVFGDGLLSNGGASWLAQRRMMQPAFHHRRVQTYGEVMVAFTEQAVAGWRDGETRDVQADMTRLTLDVIVKTMFGLGDVDEGRHTGEALTTVMDHLSKKIADRLRPPDWLPTPGNRRYAGAVGVLDELVAEIVAKRRAAGSGGDDLLAMLLEARDEEGQAMTDRQLRDELVTMFVAGHETSAQTLAFTFFLLGTHEGVRRRLLAELSEALGGRDPGVADLARLPYLEAVVKEAMRLFPAVPVLVREAVQDDEIGGYAIPAGATVLTSSWVVHRDTRWFENPEVFRPERWLDGLEQHLPRFAYFPFGGGPRVCIGNSFALMEVRLVVATVLGRFRLEPVSTKMPELVSSITVGAKDGLPMLVRAREKATVDSRF